MKQGWTLVVTTSVTDSHAIKEERIPIYYDWVINQIVKKTQVCCFFRMHVCMVIFKSEISEFQLFQKCRSGFRLQHLALSE